MEEVDKIIIDSLKNVNCDFEDIVNLKQFNAEMVILAISSCLEAILPDFSSSKKLPPAMSARLKLTSNLAEEIKGLGFRGDLGYHSILYCNEVEIRRILMFLIERLPRESNKTIPIEQTGYIPKIVKGLEESLKQSLNNSWIPSWMLHKGVREVNGKYLVHSFGNSIPLHSTNFEIPDFNCDNKILKEYWVHHPEITKQCPAGLIPSLLFKDYEFPENFNLSTNTSQQINETAVESINESVAVEHLEVKKQSNKEVSTNITTIESLTANLEETKQKYFALQNEVKQINSNLSQLQIKKNEEQEALKETLAEVKLKTKTQVIVGNEEKIAELKGLVQNANDRFVKLTNRWNNVQTPLLEELNSLESLVTSEEAKLLKEQSKLNALTETYTKLSSDLTDKVDLEQALIQKCQQLTRTNNRSSYTKRILEIIGNIKKQNDEIQKILKDTKQIQKDIKNLTGQVDRSFTLADEMIFFDAKNDEIARKAYKLLAALRDECNAILNAVTELGLAERESRNLQEQIETEKAKETGVKLDRVLSDLEQVQRDTQMLLRQSQG